MRRVFSVLVIFILACGTVWAVAPGSGSGRDIPAPGMGAGGRGLGGPHGPGGPGGPPPFARHLYPPELVLNNQIAIGLTAEQTAAIKKLLNETHARTMDLQVDLQKVTEQLSNILEPARVDEAAALAAADQAMALEGQIKNAHLALLIRIKNLLTPEQQAKLDELRPKLPADNPPQ